MIGTTSRPRRGLGGGRVLSVRPEPVPYAAAAPTELSPLLLAPTTEVILLRRDNFESVFFSLFYKPSFSFTQYILLNFLPSWANEEEVGTISIS